MASSRKIYVIGCQSFSLPATIEEGGNGCKFTNDLVFIQLMNLKVPKCEIFDLLDFNDFYIMKSL